MNKIVVLIFVIIFSSSSILTAQENKAINFAIEETPPYAFHEENKVIGILPDLVQAAFNENEYSISIKILPPKRSVLYAEQGKFDGIVGVPKGLAIFKGEVFSDVLIKITINPIILKETIIPYKTIEDIKPYTIGIVAGAGFKETFPSLKFETVSSTKSNIAKLLRKRFEIILEDPVIVDYIIMKQFIKDQNRYKALSPPLKEIDLVIGFSSNVINYKKKCNDFNKGLALIKRNGIYGNILKKWKIENYRQIKK